MSSDHKDGGESKHQVQVYHVDFRWSVSGNNAADQKVVHEFCTTYFDKFIYQLENTVSTDGNNYHYQGYGHLLDKRRPRSIKSLAISLNGQLNGIKISASSTAGIAALKNYAMKTDTRVAGPWADGSRYLGEDLIQTSELFPWQHEIIDNISTRPDHRSINVLVQEPGCAGKSQFCKYMAWHHKVMTLNWGKTGDLLNLVSKNPNRHAYFFDLFRTKPKDWDKDDIASAMEGIKGGYFCNTKYETKEVLMKCPHIWVFCNELPNIYAMSLDRWVIWEIDAISKSLVKCPPSRVRQFQRSARKRSSSPRGRRQRRSHSPSISLISDSDSE